MGRYILRRILINIPILFVITIIVFLLVEIAPGDMVDFFITEETEAFLTPQALEEMRDRFGLNDPLPVRYFKWLGRTLQGDFGFSYIQAYPVGELLLQRLQNSAILTGTGMLIAIAVGVPLGIITALRQYSTLDFTLTGLSFVGMSMPAFISGIIGLYIFAVQLHWVPAGGMTTPGRTSTLDLLHHLILPATILALIHGARFMRYTRFNMLEVLNQDYVVTATAKGLRRMIVINRHALRNALIPVVTVIGLSVSNIVAGAVFLETIFSWPGIGRLYYNAVISQDYPVIMAANLVIAVAVLATNLITDIAYAVVDPRVRYE